jgi:DNA-binding GntR family transcriptional regulator
VTAARPTLRDEVSRQLRSDIAAGLLEPQRLYGIAEVADRLGVSITPVREALLELARDGLVEVARNRGFRVREVSDADLEEIVELRVLLEIPAVRRLAGQLPPAEAKELRRLAKASVEAARSGDLSSYLQLDRDFHLRLLALAGNSRLVDVVARLRDETRLYGLGRLAGTKALVATTREHTALLTALETGDADAADAVLRGHLGHIRGVWSQQ